MFISEYSQGYPKAGGKSRLCKSAFSPLLLPGRDELLGGPQHSMPLSHLSSWVCGLGITPFTRWFLIPTSCFAEPHAIRVQGSSFCQPVPPSSAVPKRRDLQLPLAFRDCDLAFLPWGSLSSHTPHSWLVFPESGSPAPYKVVGNDPFHWWHILNVTLAFILSFSGHFWDILDRKSVV